MLHLYSLWFSFIKGEENKASEEEKAIGQPLGGTQLNVLVAEDNKMSARILDTLIKKAGHRCAIASDGKQAFDQYSSGSYDIIFMDCRMPIVDGWEATRLIREREKQKMDQQVRVTVIWIPVPQTVACSSKGNKN